jgi:3-hydroxybutyrate dehydrogenase
VGIRRNKQFTWRWESIAIAGDISKEDDCIKLVAETVKFYGRIDALINNVGLQEDFPLTEISLDEWYKKISIDLTWPFIRSREAKNIGKSNTIQKMDV